MMKIIREIHECSEQYKTLISGHHELDKISDAIQLYFKPKNYGCLSNIAYRFFLVDRYCTSVI